MGSVDFAPTVSRGWLIVTGIIVVPPLLSLASDYAASYLRQEDRRWARPLVYGGWALLVVGAASAHYAGLPLRLVIVAGLTPLVPVVLVFLSKAERFTPKQMLTGWRYAVIGAFVVSAVVTPSIDPIAQTLIATAMIVAYFLGVALSRLTDSRPLRP